MEAKNVNNRNRMMEEETGVDFKDLFVIYLSKWKWVLLSVLVCMSVAFGYLITTPPTYQKVTSILVKQDHYGNSLAGSVAQNLSDFGLVQTNMNLLNEKFIVESPDVIYEVIKRLHLNDKYTHHDMFRDEVLYGSNLPVTISFVDLEDNCTASLVMVQHDEEQVLLKDFKKNSEMWTDEIWVVLEDTASTPLGRIQVKKNTAYKGDLSEEPIFVSHQGAFSVIGEFGGKLKVQEKDKLSTVADFMYTDQNIDRAVDILHCIVDVYTEFWMRDKNEITFKTTEFIEERLKLIEEDLGELDDAIASYKSSQEMPDVAATASMDLHMSAEVEKKLQDLNNQLPVAKFLLNYVNTSSDKLLPSNVGVSDHAIQQQVAEYNKLCLSRSRLVENSSENSPLVKDLDSQMAAMRSAIVSSLNNYIATLGLQLQSVEANKRKIKSRISSNPKQAGHLLSTERQQMVKQNLYLFLLQKKEENEISQTFVPYNMRVIMEPEFGGSDAPIAPKKNKILLGALALGLLIPLGVLFLILSLNTKVRGRKDLETLSAPFVGEIPQVGGQKKFSLISRLTKQDIAPLGIVVKPQTRDVVNEAFRVVRTNVDFMMNQQNRVIMVTSANVNSGKTFVTSNLASSFGLKDEKVIVIDLDLRKRTLSKTFECMGDKGVVTYLSGKTDSLHGLIEHKNVDVLPAGTIPPNPAELLASKRLDTLIEELRKEYDYIFIDCPPVEIVTDADIIKQWVDMTLFVVRANLLEKSLLPDIERYYQEKRFNQLSIVLNGTDAVGRYGYKYGYHRGYGNGNYEGYYQ